MTKFIVSVAMLAALIGLLALAQDSGIDQLRRQVADLGLRVARLEHAGGTPHAGSADASPSGAATTSSRTVIVASISQSEHTDDHSAERSFGTVVVQRHPRIIEEASQTLPQLEHVGDCLTHFRLGQHSRFGPDRPLEQLVHQRA